jgi:hypothetical protein
VEEKEIWWWDVIDREKHIVEMGDDVEGRGTGVSQ